MLRYMYERDYRLPSEYIPGPHLILIDHADKTWTRGTESTFREPGNVLGCIVVAFCSCCATRIHVSWRYGFLSFRVAGNTNTYQYCKGKVLKYSLAARPQRRQLEDVMLSVLEPIYHSESCTFRHGSQPIGASDLTIHAKVYSIADKYFIKGFEAVSHEKFKQCMRNCFASSAFYDAVRVTFTTIPDTDNALRDLVVQRISEEKANYTLDASSDMRQALREVPDLAYCVLHYEDKLRQDARTKV
jgi:hypothetical protein